MSEMRAIVLDAMGDALHPVAREFPAPGPGEQLIYGFGAAAHIIAQIARWLGRMVYAFTRPCDGNGQAFARWLGSVWAGSSNDPPPVELDAAILIAPVGALVPTALRAVRKGSRVICGGIHMSDIPSFPYADLRGKRAIASVANLTRYDGTSFFEIAQRARMKAVTKAYPLRRQTWLLSICEPAYWLARRR